jgi:hypothetical protein
MASVAGPRPACGIHPSDFRRPGPGCPAVRCPARPVSSPSGVQPSGVRRRRSGRVRLVSHQAVAVGDRPRRHSHPHHGNGSRSRWAAASSSGSGRRPSRPGRGRRRRGHPGSAGLSVADPGRVGCGRRPRLTLASRAGQAGVRSARRRRLREGTGGGRTGREAALLGMGGRPRYVVVVAPAAWVDGPGGADGLAGGMGVRPQRGPGWQRAFPACCRQRSDLRRLLVGLPGLEPGTSSLSGFCPRACFPRIAPATCGNDLPLETVANR